MAHDWSDGHAGYSFRETQNKMDQWEFGPPTCQRLCQLNPTGCEGCINQGKVKSPIQLGVVVQQSDTPVEEVIVAKPKPVAQPLVEQVPALPESMQTQFAFVREKLVAYVKDEEDVRKEVAVCDFMF